MIEKLPKPKKNDMFDERLNVIEDKIDELVDAANAGEDAVVDIDEEEAT